MVEESKTGKYLEDIALYQYADVAGRLASNEQTAPLAKGGLERMVTDIEKYLGDKKDVIEGFKAGAFASEEGINTAIQINAGKYQKALGGLNISEFYNLRLKTLTSILGEKKAEEAKAVFAKYEGQTIGSIKKKYEQARAIVSDRNDLFDEEKKEGAKKTIAKLQPLYTLIQLLENRNYEEIAPGATKSVYKELISDALTKAA